MTQENQQKQRRNLNLRNLRPYCGTALAEVIEYLNSLDNSITSSTIESLLIMTLLPLARKHSQRYNPEQLRMTCLESCNALDKHSSYLRQTLMVPQPQFDVVYSPRRSEYKANSFLDSRSKDPNQPKTQINGQGSSADIDLVFGDD